MIEKAYLSDSRVTDISQSFTHKMAAKTSWHRYAAKLRHGHPMNTACVSEHFLNGTSAHYRILSAIKLKVTKSSES